MDIRNTWIGHPLVLGAAASVIVASLVGTAAITGYFPSARSGKAETSVSSAPPSAGQLPNGVGRDYICASCGTVQTVRIVESTGEASGLGAVAGGATGALVGNQMGRGDGNTLMTIVGATAGALAGNEIEKNAKKHLTYRVTVHMDDGSFRAVSQSKPPPVGPGARVRIVDGSVVARP